MKINKNSKIFKIVNEVLSLFTFAWCFGLITTLLKLSIISYSIYMPTIKTTDILNLIKFDQYEKEYKIFKIEQNLNLIREQSHTVYTDILYLNSLDDINYVNIDNKEKQDFIDEHLEKIHLVENCEEDAFCSLFIFPIDPISFALYKVIQKQQLVAIEKNKEKLLILKNNHEYKNNYLNFLVKNPNKTISFAEYLKIK